MIEATRFYVLGFLFRKEQTEVALIEKVKPDFLRGKLNGIGGKIEKDELPPEAMVREFREETGANVGFWKKFCTFKVLQGPAVVFAYATFGNCHLRTTTDEMVAWYPVADLGKLNIMPNLSWLVPLAAQSLVNPTSARVTLTHP